MKFSDVKAGQTYLYNNTYEYKILWKDETGALLKNLTPGWGQTPSWKNSDTIWDNYVLVKPKITVKFFLYTYSELGLINKQVQLFSENMLFSRTGTTIDMEHKAFKTSPAIAWVSDIQTMEVEDTRS